MNSDENIFNEGIDELFSEIEESEGPDLSEAEFLFANLLYKTDFKKNEIEDVLEWKPDDKQLERIENKVSQWRRSSGGSGEKIKTFPLYF